MRSCGFCQKPIVNYVIKLCNVSNKKRRFGFLKKCVIDFIWCRLYSLYFKSIALHRLNFSNDLQQRFSDNVKCFVTEMDMFRKQNRTCLEKQHHLKLIIHTNEIFLKNRK